MNEKEQIIPNQPTEQSDPTNENQTSKENEINRKNQTDPANENGQSTEPYAPEPLEMQEIEPTLYVPQKKVRTVSLRAYLLSIVSVLVAAILLTVSISNLVWQDKLIDAKANNYHIGESGGTFEQLETLDSLFSRLYYDYEKIDKEALGVALLKAYVDATGDLYAEYYTEEEYKAMTAENSGDSVGVGISVINTKVEVNGASYAVMQVIAVYEDTPAAKAGVCVGDYIAYVGSGDSRVLVQTDGYTQSLTKLRGEAGTTAYFTVWRQNAQNGYDEVPFEIVREHFTTQSVSGRVLEADASIGVVRIMQFDLTTPAQFTEAVDKLLAEECQYFVFDVRNNPGGDLASIEAVLSYFLQENDLIVSTEYKDGSGFANYVKAVTYDGDYAGCSVKKSDIGKYADLPCVVLTNGNTASAAELFTQTMRDYEIAKIVGTTTYGKGCMQSIYTLERYGIPGAMKLTTAMYFSKSHHVYHDIGIEPDVEVELSEEAQKYNVYVLPDELDNQLQAALAILK